MAILLTLLSLSLVAAASAADDVLVDCYPDARFGFDQATCESRGCVWAATEPENGPRCTFSDGHGYTVSGFSDENPEGRTFILERKAGQSSLYGGDIEQVYLVVSYVTDTILRLRFIDPFNERYEVPLEWEKPVDPPTAKQYDVSVNVETFGVQVNRAGTNRTIFDTNLPGFNFADQYLQISTRLPSSNIYGLGEHRHQRYRHDLNWRVWTIFTRDHGVDYNGNLYGAHPFYMVIEDDGQAHGVLLLNSNAMEVELQPAPALTFRTIGGILDFFIFTGPTPEEVVKQFSQIRGKPILPPYWGLGFQLCKWGYTGTAEVRALMNRTELAGIPQDIQFTDADYMQGFQDFTVGNTTWADLADLVDEIHSAGRKHIIMVDPGIAASPELLGTYPPLDDGLAAGIFIKFEDGTVLEGEVWPGPTHYPDFSNPGTAAYWANQHKRFHDQYRISFDGIWIDMNEPSSFVNGSKNGCESNKWNAPPFVPRVEGSENGVLYDKTICMDAVQTAGRHYDVHSLYAHFEAIQTNAAYQYVYPNRRPYVLTRSNYVGTGHWATHWLGDNIATFESLRDSIPQLMEFNLFGFPWVGADICGFSGNTSEELCLRWMQLGAFYPFSRNHKDHVIQDPASYGERVIVASVLAYTERYRLLPFLYTLLYDSHVDGGTVIRGLQHEFPADSNTWGIDFSFLWGPSLLIAPVVEEGVETVDVYFPQGASWYDYYTGALASSGGDTVTVDAPYDGYVPLYVREGFIIPLQDPAMNTVASRRNPMSLLVTLNADGAATGNLFWDDGESFDLHGGAYNLLDLVYENNVLSVEPANAGYDTNVAIESVTVYASSGNPSSVVADGETLSADNVSYNETTNALWISGFRFDLVQSHTLTLQY